MSVKLPPLPPVGGPTSGRSVLDVLAGQHGELLSLCQRLTEGTPADRPRVAQVLSATLCKHLSGEQQYLYPAVRQAAPDGEPVVDRELAADRDLLTALRRLDAADPDLSRLTADVTEAVRRHVAAGTGQLFPLLARTVPVEDLIRLGNRLETAEEAAPTRPHPATPSTPPWNKMVDPLVAVADKARDVLSGRVTRPENL